MTGTRERILDAAVEIFLAQGASAVSLRDIATRVDLTPMAIYRHFADKRALIEALMLKGFELYASYLEVEPGDRDALAQLEALGARIFDFAVEKTAFFELMFLTSQTVWGVNDRIPVRNAHEPTYQVARQALQTCIDAGVLEVDDIRHATNDLLAWCIGFSAFYISGKIASDQPAARRQFERGFRRMLSPYLKPSQ